MKKLTVSRSVHVPDLRRVGLYERCPDLGPRILFFSGGTALNDISRMLKRYTHNSVHLLTPFDSGGSSAALRSAFDMPAIGDLRSRLMALADEGPGGQPEVVQLFACRLPADGHPKELAGRLDAMVQGKDPLVAAVRNPMRRLIRDHLAEFRDRMPEDFDLRDASIGNLILAAGYLTNGRSLTQMLLMFSRLINVQGQVAPIVDDSWHLAARLEDGRVIVGQHLITGKAAAPLDVPIAEIYLTRSLESAEPVRKALPRRHRKAIADAELICFPPGSFYSSICVNLLLDGVGPAVAANPAPKVFIPSLGRDPEQIGLSLDDSIFRLLGMLGRECPDLPAERLLSLVLIDSRNAEGLKRRTRERLRDQGITVLDTPLVSASSAPYYDPQLLVRTLLSLS